MNKLLTRQAVDKDTQLRFNSTGLVAVNNISLRGSVHHADGGRQLTVGFRTSLAGPEFFDGVFNIRPDRPIAQSAVGGSFHSFFARFVMWHRQILSRLRKSVSQYTDNYRFVNG